MDSIAKRLRSARRNAGLTQQQLADLAGVTQGAVSNIENGIRLGTAQVVQAIAGALRLDPNWLITGEGESRALTRWPFRQVDEAAVRRLSPDQLAAVEGAMLLTMAQLGQPAGNSQAA